VTVVSAAPGSGKTLATGFSHGYLVSAGVMALAVIIAVAVIRMWSHSMGGEDMTSARNGPLPHRYRIRIRGRLGETIRSAFPALRARASGGDTVLTGALCDQAALYGVLAEIEALRLELLEVRRLPPA
jgi:hypothetical protein